MGRAAIDEFDAEDFGIGEGGGNGDGEVRGCAGFFDRLCFDLRCMSLCVREESRGRRTSTGCWAPVTACRESRPMPKYLRRVIVTWCAVRVMLPP